MACSLCLGFEPVTSLRRAVMTRRMVMMVVTGVVAEVVMAMYLVYIQDSQ